MPLEINGKTGKKVDKSKQRKIERDEELDEEEVDPQKRMRWNFRFQKVKNVLVSSHVLM